MSTRHVSNRRPDRTGQLFYRAVRDRWVAEVRLENGSRRTRYAKSENKPSDSSPTCFATVTKAPAYSRALCL